MSRKSILFILALCLLTAALTLALAERQFSALQYERLNALCESIGASEDKLIPALEAYKGGEARDFLARWGYRAQDFSLPMKRSILPALLGAGGALLLMLFFVFRRRSRNGRVLALTQYLEQANSGAAPLFSPAGEDEFSQLEDEIYKTVNSLCHSREAALKAKNAYGENLNNIAHQLKTPITSISLSLQLLAGDGDRNHIPQIQKQLSRLTHLEESLLLLARLDSGNLVLKRQETDVYTLLVLSADNLQALTADLGAEVVIPELGSMAVSLDLDWTMEAMMNLMKNCIEHNPGGRVHCFYEKNPLYVEIRIRDEGAGFDREDLPHLFERFYRGKNARPGGTGIGLALAREIIEGQNGAIRARNLPEGGACFEIRFYCH